MFIRMEKLSCCVRSPDLAGPEANWAAVRFKYLMRKRASPRQNRFRSGVHSRPRLSHSFSDHLSMASKRLISSELTESCVKTTQSVLCSTSSNVGSDKTSFVWVRMIWNYGCVNF